MIRRLLVALTLLLAGLVFLAPARTLLENQFHAFRLKLDNGDSMTGSPITVLAIDEASIDAIGNWPWPRHRWAELLARLQRNHQPALLGLDAVFPPAPEQAAGNTAFAQALREQPSALGQLMLPDPGIRGAAAWATLSPPQPPGIPPPGAMRFAGVLGSDAALVAAARTGHINASIDPDGVMRRVPTLICHQYTSTPCAASFVQAVAANLTGSTMWTVRRGSWFEAPWILTPGNLHGLSMPADEDLSLWIAWRDSSQLRYISLADIWHEKLTPGMLDAHILLVGGVSLGLGDLVISAFYERVPGVEVHAHTLHAWLGGRLPYEPRYAAPLMYGYALLMALLLALNSHHRMRLGIITAIGATLPLAGALIAWVVGRQVWPAAAPAGYILIAGAALLLALTLRERTRLLQRFRDYVPLPLRHLLTRPDAVVPSETGWGTVMVADILGYTRQSQELPLDRLATWCDTGVAHVVRHATERGAMLDTVAGDGVLLLWRTGTDVEQAAAAEEAARAIISGLPDLNRELAAQGLPPLWLGIGLHAGTYLLGSFGEEHKRFTVVSDVANIAAHIERQTRYQAWPVLLSQTVAQCLPPQATRPASPLDLGRRPLPLYTLAHLPNNHWPANRPSPPTSSSP